MYSTQSLTRRAALPAPLETTPPERAPLESEVASLLMNCSPELSRHLTMLIAAERKKRDRQQEAELARLRAIQQFD